METLFYLILNREQPNNFARWTKVLLKRLFTLPSLFYLLARPSLTRLRGAEIGKMTVLGRAKISGNLSRLRIGEQCSLGRCELAVFAELTIGSRVVINDGVKLLTASHDVECKEWSRIERPIVIEDYAWIATDAIILPGVRIGKGAVVAAGSVVTKSVPPGALCGGNPAQIRNKTRALSLTYNPTALLAPFEAWLGP